MSVQHVRKFLQKHSPYLDITVLQKSTATVAEAAEAFGVKRGQIAKTLSFRVHDGVVLLVMAGDRRLDNSKFKRLFGIKARMLPPEEVEAMTGFAPGGVCPFSMLPGVTVYCDESLRTYEEVLPAGGDAYSGVRISPEHLAQITSAIWADLSCQPYQSGT
ncbi:YbaK/EbsC family protein (plasmid) [Pantoea vagans]|uniref:YbaK/EbsC family protein n=1 Tax=Pantoea vagans TaxID=470934 RepID=UPI003518D68F